MFLEIQKYSDLNNNKIQGQLFVPYWKIQTEVCKDVS